MSNQSNQRQGNQAIEVKIPKDKEIFQFLSQEEHLKQKNEVLNHENLYFRKDELMDTSDLDQRKEDLLRKKDEMMIEVSAEVVFFKSFIGSVLSFSKKTPVTSYSEGHSEDTHLLLTEDMLKFKDTQLRVRKIKLFEDKEFNVIEKDFGEIDRNDFKTPPEAALIYWSSNDYTIFKKSSIHPGLHACSRVSPGGDKTEINHFYASFNKGLLPEIGYIFYSNQGAGDIVSEYKTGDDNFTQFNSSISCSYGPTIFELNESGQEIPVLKKGVVKGFDSDGKLADKYVGRTRNHVVHEGIHESLTRKIFAKFKAMDTQSRSLTNHYELYELYHKLGAQKSVYPASLFKEGSQERDQFLHEFAATVEDSSDTSNQATNVGNLSKEEVEISTSDLIFDNFQVGWFKQQENSKDSVESHSFSGLLAHHSLIEGYQRNSLGRNYVLTLNNNKKAENYAIIKKVRELKLAHSRGETVDPKEIEILKGLHYYGKLTYPNRDFYIGEMQYGYPEGVGDFYKEDLQDHYTGEFSGGRYNGKGLLRVEGHTYEGEFKDNMAHGFGTFTYKNGDVYTGDHVEGLSTGKGEYWMKETGDYYKGDFVRGFYEGHGQFLYGNGDSYEGEIKRNSAYGKGKYSMKDGSYSEGEFKDNYIVKGVNKIPMRVALSYTMIDSISEMNLPMIARVLLKFMNPLNHLPIFEKNKYGVEYEGEFYEGFYDGFGKVKDLFGNVYEGDFRQGLKQGYGTETYSDGVVYSGHYEFDIPNGVGRMIFQNGDKMLGTFSSKSGQLECDGVKIIAKDGSRVRGLFRDAKLVEEYDDDVDDDDDYDDFDGNEGSQKEKKRLSTSGSIGGQNERQDKFEGSDLQPSFGILNRGPIALLGRYKPSTLINASLFNILKRFIR